MKFISTAGRSEPVGFLEAAEQGLAPDGGLYMPDHLPRLPFSFTEEKDSYTLHELALECAAPFLEGQMNRKELDELISDAIHFDAPLVQLDDHLFILELFHGPTLAFKDFGARFMARLFSRKRTSSDRDLVILVATSGDTGSAVANGFYDLPGVQVTLLYPKGKVSTIQRKQMTTLGRNITALEVDGTFDDCQKLVKTAFSDDNLNRELLLSSANSINIARLLPQSFYYLHAFFQLKQYTDQTPIFSVPSGNFGNLTAGLMAEVMGLPVQKFIAATNRNDIVPRFLEGEEFNPAPSKQTLSNAMDVGDPSNFSRIRALFNGSDQAVRNHLFGASFTDEETKEKIGEVYNKYDYVADPHTAVGLLAAEKYQDQTGTKHPAIVLSTAHPAKFLNVVEKVIGRKVEIPARLKKATQKEEKSESISAGYDTFKKFLLHRFA